MRILALAFVLLMSQSSVTNAEKISIGDKSYFLGAYIDITERKKAEETIAQKNIELQKEKIISIPDDILENYLSADEINNYKNSGVRIISVTLFAEKPKDACCDKESCCN